MIIQSFVIPILKVTDSCNFTCEFCYYAQRNASSRLMTLQEAKDIIKQCFDYNVRNKNHRMRVIFHGGEPLLQPISFYECILEYENELKVKVEEFEFFNAIQTNGYLINDEWLNFFENNRFDIGISIDGPVEYNKHYGKDGVEESTKKVLENIKKLEERKIPFGVISVITNSHTQNPDILYSFCVDNNIHDLSLNYCFNNDTDDSVDNDKLITFVKRLFDLYFWGDYNLNIREFNETIAKLMGYCSDTCATCDRKNCGQYMAFDYLGNAFFCDSEYDKTTKVGNINERSLYQIIDSFDYINQLYECRKVYEDICSNCKYVKFCGGGCHRYDVMTDGKKQNYFCATHKALIEHIAKTVKNVYAD